MAADFPTSSVTKAQTGLHNTVSNVTSTLNGAISGSPSTFDVVDGSSFPSANFDVLIDSEIIHITSRASNTLTVGERGHDGTASANHDNASVVAVVFASDHAQKLGDEVQAIEQALLGEITSDIVIDGTLNATGAVDFDSTVNVDGALTATSVATDTIAEETAGAGVTIDGVLLKDNDVSATDGVFSGNVDAATYTGDGSGLTGIASGTGGVTNTGSTTIGADTDSDGTGVIALQTRGTTRLTVENQGGLTVESGGPDGPGQDWFIRGSGNAIAFQGRSSGANTIQRLFTQDGDGTDVVSYEIFGLGTPTAITNIEFMSLGWIPGDSRYQITTQAAGTGTVRPLHLLTGGNTNQLVLETGGNVGVGQSSFGTSAAGVLAIGNGTAPTTSPADAVQAYSIDRSGAGTATPHFRNEEGHIVKLFTSAAYTPTNVSTDRAFDADTVAVAELADVVGTLIADLQATGLIG